MTENVEQQLKSVREDLNRVMVGFQVDGLLSLSPVVHWRRSPRGIVGFF